jgi:hypothetical protein
MRRKQVAHSSQCKKWDRFYLINDTKKKVWILMEHTAMEIRGQVEKVSICEIDSGERRVFLSRRVIIFLRTGTRLNARSKPRTLFTTIII